MGPDDASPLVGDVGRDQRAEEEALRADERPDPDLAVVDAEDSHLVLVGGIAMVLQREADRGPEREQATQDDPGQVHERPHRRDEDAARQDDRPVRRRRQMDAVLGHRWRQGRPLRAVLLAPERIAPVHRGNRVEVVGGWR